MRQKNTKCTNCNGASCSCKKDEFKSIEVTDFSPHVDQTSAYFNLLDTHRNEVNVKVESFRSEFDQIVQGSSDAEVSQARVDVDGVLHNTLKARLDSESLQLADKMDKTDPVFKASSDSVILGGELLSGSGWTSSGWTGSFASGFTHVVGSTDPLKFTIPNSGDKYFYIKLRLTPTAVIDDGTSDFTISIGGSALFETYKGPSSSALYTFGIRSVTDGELVITPLASYTGTITELSVREITGFVPPTAEIKDSSNNTAFEIRSSVGSASNVFLGKSVGARNVDGYSNVGIGENALSNNTTGFWNTSIGSETMVFNTVGTRSVAIGRNALRANTVGDRNIGIGTFALYRNTSGRSNVAVGVDALWYNTTGSYNIGLGLNAINQNTTGSHNIGLGVDSLHSNGAGNSNVALGFNSLYSNTGNHNVGIGDRALYGNSTGSYNIGIGRNTLSFTNTGSYNIAFGFSALRANNSGSNNISLGFNSLYTNTTGGSNIGLGNSTLHLNTTGSDNVALGFESSYRNTIGFNNVSIGNQALRTNTEGDGNVAIGNGAASVGAAGIITRNVLIGHNTGRLLTTGANYNVMVGSSTGSTVTTGASNIMIGFNVQAPTETTSNYLSIGNLLYGNLSTKVIGIDVASPTAYLHVKGGNSATPGLKLNVSSALNLTPQIGAIEFFDNKLYFTDSTGTRKQLAYV